MRLRNAFLSPGAGFLTLTLSLFFLEFWLILPRRMCFPIILRVRGAASADEVEKGAAEAPAYAVMTGTMRCERIRGAVAAAVVGLVRHRAQFAAEAIVCDCWGKKRTPVS